jgi:hypothetical protein
MIKINYYEAYCTMKLTISGFKNKEMFPTCRDADEIFTL